MLLVENSSFNSLIVLAHGTYFCWIHRALHHKKLFRATHLHHHKSRTPTPYAAYNLSNHRSLLCPDVPANNQPGRDHLWSARGIHLHLAHDHP